MKARTRPLLTQVEREDGCDDQGSRSCAPSCSPPGRSGECRVPEADPPDLELSAVDKVFGTVSVVQDATLALPGDAILLGWQTDDAALYQGGRRL